MCTTFQRSACTKDESLSIPVVLSECMSKQHLLQKSWASSGKNAHTVLISALAQSCKELLAHSVGRCRPFVLFWFFEPARPNSSVEFQLCTAFQEHVNADQRFESKSKEAKTLNFCHKEKKLISFPSYLPFTG